MRVFPRGHVPLLDLRLQLLELGRLVGCDTIRLFASPLDLNGAFIGELADLRLPRGEEFTRSHTGRWSRASAERWVAEYYRERRLTLRDPTVPSDETRVEPCTLPDTPTLRLACRNHVSWTARNEPDRQNFCVRKVASEVERLVSPQNRVSSVQWRSQSHSCALDPRTRRCPLPQL